MIHTKDIKLREAREKTIKTANRSIDLADNMKKVISRTVDQVNNLTDDGQITPSEYAGDKAEYAMEDIASEAGHIVVDMGKGMYRAGQSAVQQHKEKKAKAAGDNYSETPVDERSNSVSSDQLERRNTPDNPVEERENTPLRNQRRRNAIGKAATNEGPIVGRTETKSGSLAAYRTESGKAVLKTKNQSIKTKQATDQASRSAFYAARHSAKTAERSIKNTQRVVKTAEQSSAMAIKTAQETTKAAKKTAQASAKAAQKAAQITQATAKAAAEAAKQAARAAVAAMKAIVAGVKSLVVAIAAGGWTAVLIILVIMLLALIVGSTFGIFFSSEETGTPMTMHTAIRDINMDFQLKLDILRYKNPYDLLKTIGCRAPWEEVLAVYAVRTTTDPENPQEVVSMDEEKKAILKKVYNDMNRVSHEVEVKKELVLTDKLDEYDNAVPGTELKTTTTLYITIEHKTAEEMAEVYGFSEEQTEIMRELLREENKMLWYDVLYGVNPPGEQIVGVAEAQIGNMGGRPYWSWYGFYGRVEWCACFVSWCANECGYIERGIFPKFAGCDIGVYWFKKRGQWLDRAAVPVPGMIIFFDWDKPNGSAGPQDGHSDHVGIVQKVEEGYVYTIEGNSGDSCAQRKYRIGHYEIFGYGVPAY